MTKNTQNRLSERKTAANRRNAKKSTGPKTREGKRKACMNRYKHGFYATPDKKTREEMFRIGEDPDLVTRFERKLARAWQPSDDMQAMIVADMARLYADKAQMRKVLRATRLSELREQEAAIERVDLALSHEDAISAIDLRKLGYRGMKPCQTALDESHRLLTSLFERNTARAWGEDPSSASGQALSETFALLYGERPHGVGRMIIDLFGLLAEHPERADVPLDDPRTGLTGTLRLQLATCIERERMAVMFEERHHQMQKAEEAAGDFGSAWLPGSENWGKAQMQEARLDRMIEGKVKLLIRLKRLRHSLPEEFADGLGLIDDDGGDQGSGGEWEGASGRRSSGFRNSGLGVRETSQLSGAPAKPKPRNPNPFSTDSSLRENDGTVDLDFFPEPMDSRIRGNDCEQEAGAQEMSKNEVRSHHFIENKGSRLGTNPNTKPILRLFLVQNGSIQSFLRAVPLLPVSIFQFLIFAYSCTIQVCSKSQAKRLSGGGLNARRIDANENCHQQPAEIAAYSKGCGSTSRSSGGFSALRRGSHDPGD